ncbi:MAG: DNA mismatch repair protein MutS, partial [Gammaproteobacteria bacterium]
TKDHSLVNILDTTSTAMGSRLLRRWLQQPLRAINTLRLRHDAVSALLLNRNFIQFHDVLRGIGDMERIAARIALKSAKPRDLAQLRNSLECLPELKTRLDVFDSPLLLSLNGKIDCMPDLAHLLKHAVVESPPLTIRDGGVIAESYDKELDELRLLSQNAGQFLVDLESKERKRSGIPSLKVGYNRVHGYYLEISRSQSLNVPDNYNRRQTLKATERFITPELKSFEDKILSAREKALAREKSLYEKLLLKLCEFLTQLQVICAAIAEADVLISFAERSETLNLNLPQLSETPGILIHGGRHLVVEQVQTEPFIANDLTLDENRRMLIVTGPNMGGKSTYMRQTALIIILAHIGCFVPAESAIIGPVDRIFTRIGAADDLAGGRSTFMVEMIETANILNNATSDSLILMDEIGRGTGTLDGLALAWVCAKYLVSKTGAMTLFATHFFELTTLPETVDGAANVHLDAIEHNDSIVFLHIVKEGPTNRSYGLQVAQLAGVPKEIVDEAKQQLHELESFYNDQAELQGKTDLFTEQHPLDQILDALQPDEITPMEALDILYRLKNKDF